MNSKGQGTVEYVLLLVVTIALVIMAANKLFKPFNEWAGHYLGDYVYCLIDQGELPSLGGSEIISECDKQFEQFSAKSGRPKKDEGNQANKERSEKNQKDNQGNSSAQRARGGRGGGSSGRLVGSGRGADGGEGSGAKKKEDLGEPSASKFYRVRLVNLGSSGSGKKSEASGLAGLMGAEIEQKKRQRQKIQKVAEAQSEGASNQQKKMIVKPPERRLASASEESEPWSFGKLFRVAIILMIIIAIVLFLGNQALQIIRSMEK